MNLSANYTYEDDLLKTIQTPSTTYTFEYGDFSLRTAVKVGNRNLASYTYETGTNRLQRLDYGNGDRVEYTYDSQGRLLKETYENGETVSYAYDNSGNLATVTDSETGTVTTYYYDLLNRQSGYREQGANIDHTVKYEYDEDNNIASLTEVINGVMKTYTYTYDDDNRIISESVGGVTVEYTYDGFGRLETRTVKQGETVIQTSTPTYSAGDGDNVTTGQISSYNGYTYTYDDNGNILTISDGTYTTSYEYDSANQLIRENNQQQGFTRTWTYDSVGNIQNRKEYAYTTGELGSAIQTVYYDYIAQEWGDLLTAYGGNEFDYDTIGNLTYDGEWEYTWQHGRQLASMTDGATTWTFTYDAGGMRTERSPGDEQRTYTYVYNGSKLTQMAVQGVTLRFAYDASGTPLTVTVDNSAVYYYKTNLQGDVIGILNSAGVQVVTYAYDAWGNVQILQQNDQIVEFNPLLYRGYVYDWETGLYYLQSRYYNPEWGRFINADSRLNRSLGFLGFNQFSYCLSNSVNMVDYDGNKPGDLFDTMDEAAKDFAKYINGTSITDNREYYSYIYTVKVRVTKTYINPNILGFSWLYWFWDGLFGGSLTKSVTVTETKYTYKEPVKGAKDNVILQAAASLLSPKVAMLHTHGGFDSKYASDVFSDTDKQFANLLNLPFYVATPLGTLRKYSPSDGSDIELYGDFPFDPNHPGR